MRLFPVPVVFVSTCLLVIGYFCVKSFYLLRAPISSFVSNESAFVYSDSTVHHRASTDSRIFFHEVSGRSSLTWRELCSVEAAARYNPSRPIQLFMSTLFVNKSDPWFETLSSYPNLELVLLDNDEYFKDTLLEEWYEGKAWQFSEFEIPHLAQYIRFVTLYKGGGQYLDLDVLLFKSLDEKLFRNYFSFNSKARDEVDGAAFHLNKGHKLIETLMRYLSEHYDPSQDIYHGSKAIVEVLDSYCNGNLNSCPDVKLMSHEALFPVPWFLSGLIADRVASKDGEAKLEAMSHGIHLYHNSLDDTRIDSEVLFAKLARKHCPRTVGKMKEKSSFIL